MPPNDLNEVALEKSDRIGNLTPCARLDALDNAESLAELNLPGFDFHGLHGKPKRYSMHVNGPWCLTFEWIEGEALEGRP